jgi:hypothetical protein
MDKIYLILICLLANLFQSCQRDISKKESTNNPLIRLNVVSPDSYIKTYSSIFSNVNKIYLETSADCLIGDIRSLRIVDNDIYIIQQISSSSSLLRFNQDGRFLNVIGSSFGKGPKEIMNPRCFYIDNDVIEVWSKLNISQFSKNGKFIKKIFNAYFAGVGFFKDEGFYYLYHSATPPYMLTQYKSHGGIKAQYLSYNFIDAISSNDKVLFYDNQVSLFSSVCDTIYAFTNGKVLPKAYFKFVNMSSPASSLKNSNNISEFLVHLKDNCVITNYFENSNYIFFEFSHNRKLDYCLYNKKNDKSIYFNNKITDDVTGIPFNAPVCLTADNYLIIPAYPNEFKNKANKDKNDAHLSDLFDNPILLFCKLKTNY